MSSLVVSMMARTLTVAGSHRYYFDATFRKEVGNFRANGKTPLAEIVATLADSSNPISWSLS